MSQPSGGQPSEDQSLGFGEWVRVQLVALCPDWMDQARLAIDEIAVTSRLVIDLLRREPKPAADAVMGLFSQAGSDYMDLLVDAATGRGRPAVRTARALFEAHVGVLDCRDDSESAERWLDTMPTADALLGELALPERHLRGKIVKGYRHRVSVAAKPAARALATAEARWGRKLRDRWHRDNLRQRALSHGLGDAYEFYRFASAPTHASGGGSFGLRRIRKDGGPTIRTGSALELVPIAVLYGTDAIRGIVRAVEPVVHSGLAHTLGALDRLDERWQELYIAIRTIDADSWPTTEPVNRAALILIEANGTRSCYEYLPELRRSRQISTQELRIDDRQHKGIDALNAYLAHEPHGRVGVYVHEATPMVPPADTPWIVRDFGLDDEFHVLTDGTVGPTREELDKEQGT